MTISGTINGSYTGEAGRYSVKLVYSYDQNTVANTSTVTASFQIRCLSSPGAYSNLGSASLSFGGYSVTWNPINFDFRDLQWHTVISMSNKVVQHSNDGTKVLQFAASFATNDSDISAIKTAWANGSVTLQPIDRYSTFGTLTPFVIENEWSVPVNKYIQSETDTLTIEYGTFTKTITPYISGQTIQFTAAELSSLYAITTSISTIPFTLTITTGNLGSSTATLNGTITPVPPTFTATITTSPSSAVSGQTNVAVTLSASATAHEGGTITEYVVSLGSQTVRANTHTATFSFTGVDGDTVTAQAVDSRGWASAPITKTITLYPYNAPTVSASVARTPTMADTSAQLSLSGTYSVVPGQTLTASYRYRTGGGAWSNATTITLTYSSGSYSFSATLLDTFNLANAYEFEITVTDLYQSTVVTTTLLSAEPTIDLDTSTQRVKIGGFLGSEDAKSLSVVGDIYEGGVKLEDKYAPIGGSGKYTLLWSGSASTMGATTLTLSQSALNFDFLICEASYWGTGSGSAVLMRTSGITNLLVANTNGNAELAKRTATVSGTSVTLTNGRWINGGSSDNSTSACIPHAIYGVAGGGGGGSSSLMTTLWTNSSPTAAYAGQTVTLSQDASNFDIFLVQFLSDAGTPRYQTAVAWAGQICTLLFTTQSGTEYNRTITISGTQGVFGNGMVTGSTVNGCNIPQKIVGIKF